MKESDAWLMRQTWEHLLFVHWRVPVSFLESIVPFPLKLDLFQNEAWVGLVPFEASHIRLRGLPKVPYFSRMMEFNIRTYVTYKGEKGVYFFSLDANQLAGVLLSRNVLHLPYFNAAIKKKEINGVRHLYLTRKQKGAAPAECEIRYNPVGEVFHSEIGSIEHWLTERYCLFNPCNGHLYRGKLQHESWALQEARCEIVQDTLTKVYKRPSEQDKWLVHYSRKMNAEVKSYHKIY